MKIKSKKDLKYFIDADRIALGGKPKLNLLKRFVTPNYIHRFQKLLRKCEYYYNTKTNFLKQILYFYYVLRFHKLSLKLGFSIPLNCFGPGLSIAHIGPIIINKSVKVGSNCRIHVGTNIGTQAGFADKAPILGDNIYIGPGAVIYGAVSIANNCAIGANAVVNKDFFNEAKVIAGVPAKEIATIEIKSINILATKIIDLNIEQELIAGLTAQSICKKFAHKGY